MLAQSYFEVEKVQLNLCIALWMVLTSMCQQRTCHEEYWQRLGVSYQSDP